MKTIAICNHKGGVGKTALSMAIAEGLHRKGKRTLLVDLDQQMNATQQAKIDTTDEVTVYDLLTSFDYTAKDGIKHFDGGDIIPGDVLVSNAESDMAKLDTRLTMLADAMEGIDDDYDYAIIDCPPSLGLVTRNAMVAADELIVPVIPNRSSLKGFTNIQKCVNSVRRNKRLNPNLRIAGMKREASATRRAQNSLSKMVASFEQGDKYAETVTKAVTDGATQAVEETVQAGTKAIDEVAKKSAKSIEKLEQAANARAKRFMRITKPEVMVNIAIWIAVAVASAIILSFCYEFFTK